MNIDLNNNGDPNSGVKNGRIILAKGADSWLRVSIANVGDGLGSIFFDVDTQLSTIVNSAKNPNIVNMSLRFNPISSERLDTANDQIHDKRDTLFVAAAGNSYSLPTQDLDHADLFPASFGGAANPNLIVVAALDGTGGLAPFADYGANSVDIAAPGCQINSWVDEKGRALSMSGSSQAAPFVTLAAALVESLGVSSPRTIKNRLSASGDLLPTSDRTKIFSQSKLNIAKALLPFDDYVRFKNDEEAIGILTDSPKLSCASQTAAIPDRNVWAIKRSDAGWFVFQAINNIVRPCSTSVSDGDTITFAQTAAIRDGKIVPEIKNAKIISLDSSQEIVRATER